MEIEEMRETILDKLGVYPWEMDVEIETSPGNYGLEDIHIGTTTKNIWVEVPKRTFTFQGELSFTARLGASGKSGYSENFRKKVTGAGRFDFVKNSPDLMISDVQINEEFELYEGAPDI